MSYSFITNAEIEGAEILFERGFILSAWVYVSMASGSQGVGGFVLGGSPFDHAAKCAQHDEQANLASDFIGGVLAAVGVEKWSQLKGKIVRIGKNEEYGDILAIGHAVKDRWYEPRERMKLLAKARAEQVQP